MYFLPDGELSSAASSRGHYRAALLPVPRLCVVIGLVDELLKFSTFCTDLLWVAVRVNQPLLLSHLDDDGVCRDKPLHASRALKAVGRRGISIISSSSPAALASAYRASLSFFL